ncbi:MAG TPA: hypothetical protein DCQ98_05005 [Planctomycetaceae bacterium]|nr:hypothetical protein [Planctomycetaceae bacterium]HRE99594.1 heme NO-binding domain-containing protein [Pirellulaceae bacterium]
MKGVVFTEFLDLVENRFGLETVERVLDAGQTATNGAYTAVGTYDHRELLRMVVQLATETGLPVSALVKAFGGHLFDVFRDGYPGVLESSRSTFEFLPSVEQAIHVEMRKLYPDAELPDFEYERSGDDSLTVVYRSSRPFADLAEGLIEACIRHYGDDLQVAREDLPPFDGTSARFTLTRRR